MDDLNVIDRFVETFGLYIDSGFGLLGGEVAFLVTILVSIDIALAGLFWALGNETNVIAQLIRKVLYVGFFALLLNNFQSLAGIVFQSFAGLGLEATGGTISAADLLRPGFVAGAGFAAAHPLLAEAQSLLGFTSVFNHAPALLILLFAWIVIVLSFFILAVQIFITLIEFKLTTLAGFVLVPFALWGKTTFLAERVLGNVIAAGVKIMVLAVIVGIGSTIFSGLAAALNAGPIDIEHTMSLVLAAMALLGLGVFGPGIASGLVSGAPQLGAGAAIGTAAGLAAGTIAGAGGAIAAGRAVAGGAANAVRSGASLAGGAGTAYGLASATSGASGLAGAAAGLGGIARAGAGAMTNGAAAAGRKASDSVGSAHRAGQAGAYAATGGGGSPAQGPAGREGSGGAASSPNGAPDWARRMRTEQRLREAGTVAVHTIRDGDRPASAEAPRLRDED